MNGVVRRGWLALVLSACLVVLVCPSVARADDGPPVPIGWPQLGLAGRVELLGSNEPIEVSLPVPQGVSPGVVTGTIGPAVLATGRVDVTDARGVVLGSIPIPVEAAAVPFVVDVSAAEVLAGSAKLGFVIRAGEDANADRCRQPPSVTLDQLALTYSAPTPSPATVADFLPGYVDRITIWVGPSPSREAQQAALTLVAELTRLYRPMPVRIDVDTAAARPTSDGPGTRRTIAIVEADRPGLVVENGGTAEAVLVVSGKGDGLLRQVDLFTDRRFGLAQTPSAAVTSADRGTPATSDTLSFADLDTKAETSVLGVSTVFVGFDAAAFGAGPINGAKVHLLAKYTPVTNADASLLIRSGSAVLASAVLDQSGKVDLTADVPADAISSNVALALEVRYVPRRDCTGALDRMTFVVDSASTITVSPGSTGRDGFATLPMAFTPEFDVALDDVTRIGYAAQAVNLMAQQTTVALRPQVTTLDAAVSRRSGLLVVATGAELASKGLLPPLLMKSTTDVDVNGSPVTGVDVNGPLGAIEAFSRDGRTILAIDTSGDSALLDRSFDYVRGLSGRWASLAGDVVATGAAGTTVELAVGPTATATNPVAESATGAWPRWAWLLVAVVAVALVAAAGLLFVRRRRRL